jgi:hypothetical protein
MHCQFTLYVKFPESQKVKHAINKKLHTLFECFWAQTSECALAFIQNLVVCSVVPNFLPLNVYATVSRVGCVPRTGN